MIQAEQPELEAQKTALLRQEEALKVQLSDLEKNLLQVRSGGLGGRRQLTGRGSRGRDGWAPPKVECLAQPGFRSRP